MIFCFLMKLLQNIVVERWLKVKIGKKAEFMHNKRAFRAYF